MSFTLSLIETDEKLKFVQEEREMVVSEKNEFFSHSSSWMHGEG